MQRTSNCPVWVTRSVRSRVLELVLCLVLVCLTPLVWADGEDTVLPAEVLAFPSDLATPLEGCVGTGAVAELEALLEAAPQRVIGFEYEALQREILLAGARLACADQVVSPETLAKFWFYLGLTVFYIREDQGDYDEAPIMRVHQSYLQARALAPGHTWKEETLGKFGEGLWEEVVRFAPMQVPVQARGDLNGQYLDGRALVPDLQVLPGWHLVQRVEGTRVMGRWCLTTHPSQNPLPELTLPPNEPAPSSPPSAALPTPDAAEGKARRQVALTFGQQWVAMPIFATGPALELSTVLTSQGWVSARVGLVAFGSLREPRGIIPIELGFRLRLVRKKLELTPGLSLLAALGGHASRVSEASSGGIWLGDAAQAGWDTGFSVSPGATVQLGVRSRGAGWRPGLGMSVGAVRWDAGLWGPYLGISADMSRGRH